MEFTYKGKNYQVSKLVDDEKIVIFEFPQVSEEEDEEDLDLLETLPKFLDWAFIDREDIIDEAKQIIDYLEKKEK